MVLPVKDDNANYGRGPKDIHFSRHFIYKRINSGLATGGTGEEGHTYHLTIS